MKASQMGSKADIGLGHALMPSYLAVHPQKATFISFQMQPISCSQLLTHWADSVNDSVWLNQTMIQTSETHEFDSGGFVTQIN